ncbi:HAD family hydrolase [Mucilaginibacter arboris]|uniref:Beta-phosphoglucomutase n=1 Tax=Mucilaginibacter arboris TaxID=2682090 RepID=A0A7K1SZ91_9SPHI|nr:HAD family phosphatase [Mucilaginibacter arboris]MVN22577.1 beta-phosphoglucomutase family hydrolase [Mucilaginibacter arboris]
MDNNQQPDKAFLFDMDGTMADNMKFHAEAWFDILNDDLGAGLTKEEVKKEMYGKNPEVLERIFGKGKFSQQEMDEYSMKKEKDYQSRFKPHLKLIDGLEDFLKKADEQQIPMAIASAAIPFNIDYLLDHTHSRNYFKAIISADDVDKSKPNPETFLKAAEALGAKPEDCIVFEDAPKGVEAAKNAGMKCVALTTAHEEADFKEHDNVLYFIKDYRDERVLELLKK